METKKITLTNFNNRKFDIHTYIQSNNPKLKKARRPLIIVIPGGSFDHLSLRESEPVALSYNSHGYNSVVMEYNLVQDQGKIYPDAALDVLTTVKYFREHADQYQINPDKIITIGFSAGGHVATAANYIANNQDYQQKYGYTSQAVIPNKTILGYPLINIDKLGFPIPEAEKAAIPTDPKLCNSALGVTRETPATFIFQAWDDPIVLIANSIEYISALNNNHVDCEAHLYTKGLHGFSLARPETEEKGQEWETNRHAASWFYLSLEWLRQELN